MTEGRRVRAPWSSKALLRCSLLANVKSWSRRERPVSLHLWPELETDFFLEEVDAQLTFVRGATASRRRSCSIRAVAI
jgi:hypothetical protein